MRPMIEFVKKRNGDNFLIGCEIGVDFGFNALDMFINLNLRKLFLVDSYDDSIKRFLKMRKNLLGFNNKCVFIIKRSDNAVKLVDDNLDFVYIDGSHKFDDVLLDIELYYEKVRKGGVIGGHDIQMDDVLSAVDEYFGEKYIVSGQDWWYVKK